MDPQQKSAHRWILADVVVAVSQSACWLCGLHCGKVARPSRAWHDVDVNAAGSPLLLFVAAVAPLQSSPPPARMVGASTLQLSPPLAGSFS